MVTAVIPKFPPHILAAVDQWLAGANHQLAKPLEKMKAMMASPAAENQLAAVALFIGDRAAGDRNECRELACAYMLALHQLAMLQQKQESR